MTGYSGTIAWFVVLALLSSSDCHILTNMNDEPVCPLRSVYNMLLRNSLVGVENAIRDAVHSVTEQILTCPDAVPDCAHTDQAIVRCPEGALQRGKSCYIFSEVDATWGEAMESCIKNFGGHLAVITDEEENNSIKEFALRERPGDKLWIGGVDAFKEGEWRWITTMETISSSKFSDWQTGQPDNGSGTEHCLELNPIFDFRWNDDQCYHRHKYICEKDMEKH